MKTYIYSILAATMAGALCLPLGSCSESAELGGGKYTVSNNKYKLKVSSESFQETDIYDHKINNYILNLGQYGLTCKLTIDAENTPWKFANVPDWIKISPMSGNGNSDVSLAIDSNIPLEEERTAELALESTVQDWKYSIPITVNKTVVKPTFYDKSYLSNFDSEGGTKNAMFSSNFTPTIAYSGNEDNWVSAIAESNGEKYYSLPGYTLHVTAKPNTKTSSRTAYILIRYKDKDMGKFEVSQYAFYPSSSVSNSYFYIDSKGETKVLTYTANFTPTIQYDEIKSWCKASIDTDKKTITLTVSPNETETTRSGYLYLMYNGKKQQSVNIYQYAFSASASFGSSYIYADKKGASETVSYTANFIPTLQCDEVKDWCDVTINKSNKTVSVKVKQNNTGKTRSGYIYLMYNGKNKASMRIYQEG